MVYALVLVGVFYFAVQRDWRLGALVSNPPTTKELVGLLTLDQNTLLQLSQRFIFLERMVYWLNGWNVFNQYPWLGVGLGNAGFFFPKLAPAMGWATFEIRNVLFYLHPITQCKKFLVPLVGRDWDHRVFGVYYLDLRPVSVHQVLTSQPKFYRENISLRRSAFLLAFIGEGFSIDSFAMPYLWVMAGLIASIALISRREWVNQSVEGD